MLARTRYLARMGEVFWMAGRSAEGLAAIAEALALVERTGERVAEAEIWRVKGELLLKAAASDAQAEAERCYHQAIDIARQQHAKSWELRATTSLARLWQRQGKTAGSAADAGGDLRLVHRRLWHGGLERRQGVAGGSELRPIVMTSLQGLDGGARRLRRARSPSDSTSDATCSGDRSRRASSSSRRGSSPRSRSSRRRWSRSRSVRSSRSRWAG